MPGHARAAFCAQQIVDQQMGVARAFGACRNAQAIAAQQRTFAGDHKADVRVFQGNLNQIAVPQRDQIGHAPEQQVLPAISMERFDAGQGGRQQSLSRFEPIRVEQVGAMPQHFGGEPEQHRRIGGQRHPRTLGGQLEQCFPACGRHGHL